MPARTSVVASGANGLVETFSVEEGQFVPQGAPLCVLRMKTADLEIREAEAVLEERRQALLELQNGSRPEEIAEAKARMLSLKATKENTAKRFERIEQLYQQKAVNDDDLDLARERAEAANQQFLAAQAQYELIQSGPRTETIEQAEARFDAQQEQVDFLKEERNKRTSRAPFDGYVVEEHTDVGQWLSQGDPVVTQVELKEVDVVVNVDQRDLRHVRIGRPAEVRVATTHTLERIVRRDGEELQGLLSYQDAAILELVDKDGIGTEISLDAIQRRGLPTGLIKAIVPRSDWETGSRGFPVQVRMANFFVEAAGQKQPVLNEGMLAEVTFEGVPQEALLIPKDALVRGSSGMIIYVFDPDQIEDGKVTARRVAVETGISDATSIQVKAEGLTEGQHVVAEGVERLNGPVVEVQLKPVTGK